MVNQFRPSLLAEPSAQEKLARMKILVVGSSGIIGSAVANALSECGQDIVEVTHSGEGLTVDLSDIASIKALYDKVGKLDAVVCLSLIHI